MSRLTRNQEKFWGKDNYKGEKYIIGCDGVTSKQMCLDKLGKLEDLEEELGCPLEVIVRAVKYGIYIKNKDGEMVNFKCELYYKNLELGWYFLIINGYVPLTDYKTKFWLKKDKSE